MILLSALLHTTIHSIQAILLEYSGSMPFFLSMVLAIMVEDGVQALWRRLRATPDAGSSSEGYALPLWLRTVGLLWVMVWLGVTSTWYWPPTSCLLQEETTLVPLSLVERVGVEPVGVMLLLSGADLYFGLGIEV